jgi:uncharacterized membrane protein YdjX (TVP38/TMEM64 family)
MVLALLLTLVVIVGRPVVAWLSDPDGVRAQVESLGPLAPLGFVVLTAVQVVVAPLPAFPTQLLGGALFGPGWGSLYNIAGMLAGGLLATWLARKLGRPWLEKRVDPEQLARYESLVKLDTTWVWAIILLLTIPLGDFPYYLAGLSRLRLSQLAVAILCSRTPSVVVVTWAGASAVAAPAWLLPGLLAAIVGLGLAAYTFRQPLMSWLERHWLARLR